MKTRILTWLFVLLAAPVFAQQIESPTTITTAGASCAQSNCAEVSMRGIVAADINVVGAGTYTLKIQVSRNGGVTWDDASAIDYSDPDTIVSTITAAGNFNVVNGGLTNLKVFADTGGLTSGTPVVTITRGFLPAVNTLAGTGGVGGTATEYTEGASDATITGIVAMMEDANTIRPLQGTIADGLLVNLGSNNDVTVTGSVTANAGTNLNTSLLALESGGNLAAAATSLGLLDNAVSGSELQVDVLTMPTVTVTATDLDVQSGGADILSTTAFNAAFGTAGSSDAQVLSVQGIASGTALPISGSISCSNCTGSGASDVEGSTFALGTDSVAPAGFYFDDVTPTAATEDRIVLPRVSGNRNIYSQIRDGAGNERGAIVTANNELLVELGAGSASIGTLGANSGVDIGDVTLTAGSADIGNVNLEIGGTAITAGAGAVGATTPRVTLASDDPAVASLAIIAGDTTDIEAAVELIDNAFAGSASSYAAVRLTDGSNFITLGSDGTHDTPLGTITSVTGPMNMGRASAAAPSNVSADNDAVLAWYLPNGAGATVLTAAGALIGGDATNGLDVDVTRMAALVAGNANIGDVDVASIAAGDNDIGNVDLEFAGTAAATNAGANSAQTLRVTVATDDEMNDDIDAIRIADQLIDNASFTDEAAFTYATSGVTVIGAIAESTTDTLADGTAGAPVMTLARALRTTATGYLGGGGTPVNMLSDASDNEDETAICTGPCTVYSIYAANHTAASAFLRCENDTAANTTPGSETAADNEFDLEIPASTTGAGFIYNPGAGIGASFSTALTCWIVSEEASSGTTDVAANDVRVQFVRVQ